MNRNTKGKSYNEVMNEWAAQKHFLKRAANGLMRPGSGVTGGARIRGWFWRVFIFTSVPLLLYIGFLRSHTKSGEFTTQLAAEAKKFLGAENVTSRAARWDLNGELRVSNLEVVGKPQNMFSKLKVQNLSTVIPVPRVFRAAWELDRVEATACEMELRPGSLAKQASLAAVSQDLLSAGYGISPDFSKLVVNSYSCGDLKLLWGSAPSTSGEIKSIKDSPVKTTLTRTDGGWNLALAGGTFRQCWLSDLRITRAEAQIRADRVDISRGDFTVAGGGSGTLTGSFTLGAQPEVNIQTKLENTSLHPYISEYFAKYIKATGHGTVKISGSTNRTNGLLLDSSLKILSGKLTGIPVLHALELATNETGISAPDITGGEAHITSQGTQDAGGLVIEADSIKLDCGTRLKLDISVRYERKQEAPKDLTAAKLAAENKAPANKIATSTKGTVRIGLPPATADRLKPAIRQQFIPREDQGLQWLDIPFILDADTGEFTKDAAEKITALHFTGAK